MTIDISNKEAADALELAILFQDLSDNVRPDALIEDMIEAIMLIEQEN